MRRLIASAAAVIAATMLVASPAHAGVIISPTSATASSTAPAQMAGDFDINNTIDHSGLVTNFTSGVTDFDTYLAGNPIHVWPPHNNEWFTQSGQTSATVNYDLGSAMFIDAMAFWNEDGSGSGPTNVLGSVDGISYFLLAVFNPTDNTAFVNYPANVVAFTASLLRHIRLEISGCPQSGTLFIGCSIGEVAFRVSDIPIPGAIPLFFAGLAGLGFAARRRRARA